MARTKYGMEYGVEYAYQEIKNVKYRVFANKKDWRQYHLLKEGMIPPYCSEWKLAQVGEWTQGDGEEQIDRGIVRVLHRKDSLPHPNDRDFYKDGTEKKEENKHYSKGYIRTVVGSFLLRKNTKMTTDFNKIENRYRFSQLDDAHVRERRAKKDRITAKEKQWVIASSVSSATPEILIGIYMALHDMEDTKKNKDKAQKRIERLFEKDYIVEKLLATIKERALRVGISEDFVLQNYFELAAGARREDVRLTATTHCERVIGLTALIEKRSREVLEPSSDNPNGAFSSFDEVSNEQSVKDLVGTQAISDAKIMEDNEEYNKAEEVEATKQVEDTIAANQTSLSLQTSFQPKADLGDLSPPQTETEISTSISDGNTSLKEEMMIYGI